MIKLSKDHKHEYPIERFWYTKHSGLTIEELIDKDLPFFEWAVGAFQEITPAQAAHYIKKTGHRVPPQVISDVVPYSHQEGDPDQMYMDLCETRDLDAMIFKWRKRNQLELF